MTFYVFQTGLSFIFRSDSVLGLTLKERSDGKPCTLDGMELPQQAVTHTEGHTKDLRSAEPSSYMQGVSTSR